MRFWRRSRRRRNSSTLDNNSSGIVDYSLPDGNRFRWNPLFRVNHSGRVKPFNLSINPFLHHAQELRGHVPKCLARVSQSEILMGQRVENFSSECWLQNHLHQFAHTSANDIQNSNIETAEAAEEMDDVEDDSPVGSDTERHSNTSLDNFEFESNDGDIPSEGMDNELPPDILTIPWLWNYHHTMMNHHHLMRKLWQRMREERDSSIPQLDPVMLFCGEALLTVLRI